MKIKQATAIFLDGLRMFKINPVSSNILLKLEKLL
jgi:hypothetical protein